MKLIFDGSYNVQVKYQDYNCGLLTEHQPGYLIVLFKKFVIRSEDEFIGTGIDFSLESPQFIRPNIEDIDGVQIDLSGNINDETFITGLWTCDGKVGEGRPRRQGK